MAINLTVEEGLQTSLTVEDSASGIPLSVAETYEIAIDDYNELRNKPRIASVELTGDKSLDDLGAYSKAQVDTKLSAKADKSQIPSLNGYATERWVENQGYLTEHQSLEGYATEEWVEGKHYLTTAPVISVNGKTGEVTVAEGLTPLIGTTATVTPQQVMVALGEGRDVCVKATATLLDIPVELKFTSFNRATDTSYGGQAIDVVISQTIAVYDTTYYLFELVGGLENGTSLSWAIIDTQLVDTVYFSRNVSGFITTETDPTVSSWAKQPNKPTYTASEVGALPADTVIPVVPSNISAFNNDVPYLTAHQSLAAYQTKNITDAGGYFSTDTVEAALQELGSLVDGVETLLAAI